MESGLIKRIAKAAQAVLAGLQGEDGQPLFKSGTHYVPVQAGPAPGFHVSYEDFRITFGESNGRLRDSVTTHRFEIQVYFPMNTDERAAQERLWALIQACVNAFGASPRLGGAALRSRLTAGKALVAQDGKSTKIAVATFTLEADTAGIW